MAYKTTIRRKIWPSRAAHPLLPPDWDDEEIIDITYDVCNHCIDAMYQRSIDSNWLNDALERCIIDPRSIHDRLIVKYFLPYDLNFPANKKLVVVVNEGSQVIITAYLK